MKADSFPLAIERAAGLGRAAHNVAHGFFGHGGPDHPHAHQFGYGGPGAIERVRADRAAAAAALIPGAPPVLPNQTHSCDVVVVTRGWDDAPQGRPIGDAVVTAVPGLALGIVTADCAPVLLCDARAGVIGAAHAGWRGARGAAQGGVLENTIAAMEALGAVRTRIAAAIGPTIAQASYEVDAPFRAHFTPGDEPHFARAPDRAGAARWHFDLPGYIVARLRQSGLGEIEALGRDTFAQPERYYSYRRASQHGESDYGRLISLIALV